MTPRLIGSATSPFVRKVRIAALLKGQPLDFKVVASWDEENGVADIAPLAKVPVLITPEGEALFDSNVIIQWLDLVIPTPRLIAADGADALLARRITALADGVADAVALHLQEHWRKPEARSAVILRRNGARIGRGLAELERFLTGPWFVGSSIGLADIAAFCSAEFAWRLRPDFAVSAQTPHLAALVAKINALHGVADTGPPSTPAAKPPAL